MTSLSTSSSSWGLSVGSWSSPCMDLERGRAPADLNQSKNKSIGMGDRRKERRREESMGRSREGPCAVRRRRRRARARASRRSRWRELLVVGCGGVNSWPDCATMRSSIVVMSSN